MIKEIKERFKNDKTFISENEIAEMQKIRVSTLKNYLSVPDKNLNLSKYRYRDFPEEVFQVDRISFFKRSEVEQWINNYKKKYENNNRHA